MKLAYFLWQNAIGCWLPVVVWMAGAFILGWMFRRWFGGSSLVTALLQENKDIKAKQENLLIHYQSRYNLLEAKNHSLQKDYENASSQSAKLAVALAKLGGMTNLPEEAGIHAPVTAAHPSEVPAEKIVEQLVEKRIEDPSRIEQLQMEVAALKKQLEIQADKPEKEVTGDNTGGKGK